MIDFSEMKLGKQEYEHDDRTLMLANYLSPVIHVPSKYDFDARRAGFPEELWGNDEWGDCVICGRANCQVRLERVEQRKTIKIVDSDVIDQYKYMTGSQSSGDGNDVGLVMLEAHRQWKNEGWAMQARPEKVYTISAYGEVDPADKEALRACIYMLGGVHFGFSLPIAAQKMTNLGVWDFNGQTDSEFQPGSWGGHAVYGLAYDENQITVITWGKRVKVTNSFVSKYCDEAWGVVDSLDSWRTKQTIDVPRLLEYLKSIAHRVNP